MVMPLVAGFSQKQRAERLQSAPMGYTATDAGLIPDDWLEPELVQIARDDAPICYGIVQVGPYEAKGVPVLAIKNLNSDYFTSIHRSPVEIEQAYARSRIRPDDVIISVKGTTGRIGIAPAGFFGNISRDLARIRLREGIVPHFCFQMLQSEMMQQRLAVAAVGTTRMELSIATLKTVRIPVPPTEREQQAIAGALSDADALIESIEQLIAKKSHIKQGAMQELLTGNKRMSGFKGEWKVKPLGDLFTFSGGFSASRDDLTSNGYCYLHYGDIHKSNKAFIDVRSDYPEIPKLDIPLNRISRSSLLENGDVVFVDASEDLEGTTKHVVIINRENLPFISGLHTIVAKPKTEELNHDYRRYCFQTKAVRDQFYFFAVGTKVSGISKTNIAKVTLPVPPPAEQVAIAAILADMDADITAHEAKVAKVRQVKQGMMQELLTGKIRLV